MRVTYVSRSAAACRPARRSAVDGRPGFVSNFGRRLRSRPDACAKALLLSKPRMEVFHGGVLWAGAWPRTTSQTIDSLPHY